MSDSAFNMYRAAIEVLMRGRVVLVKSLTEEILANADDFADGGFAFNEFLESQGTRLHFLTLLLAQLEQSAEALDDARNPPSPPAPKRRRSRTRRVDSQPSAENSTDDP